MENRFISLANKYRPQKFSDLVGQETISKTLTNTIKLGRIGHGYLFYGPRGCGKTTSARIFAKSLNCTGSSGPTAEPCGVCPQCVEIANSSDIDVLELDAASNTQVEKIREAIIDTVSLASARDRFKIFILDEVHMLSDSSFNALLKTIEEPPAHVVFILATTEKHKVPATIVSRCQTFRFSPIAAGDITGRLNELAKKENIEIEPKAVALLAKNASGAMRDALTLFDRAIAYSDGKIDEFLVSDMLGLMPEEILKNALSAIIKKDRNLMHQTFEAVAREGYDPLSFLRDLKNALGEMFYLSLGHAEEPFAGAKDLLDSASAGFLAALTRKITKVIDEVKFSDTPLINAEVGIFTVMDGTVDIEGLVKRLEALESGTPVPAPTTGGGEEPAAPKKIKAAPPKIETATPAPKPEHKVQPQTAPQNNASLFARLKEAFSSNPFVADALEHAAHAFSGDTLTLSFDETNAFYKTALEMKLDDLSASLENIADRKIKINFGATNDNVNSGAERAAAPEPARAIPGPKTEEKRDEAFISTEKPFSDADFSSDAKPEPPAKKLHASPEILDILKIIPGTVIE